MKRVMVVEPSIDVRSAVCVDAKVLVVDDRVEPDELIARVEAAMAEQESPEPVWLVMNQPPRSARRPKR